MFINNHKYSHNLDLFCILERQRKPIARDFRRLIASNLIHRVEFFLQAPTALDHLRCLRLSKLSHEAIIVMLLLLLMAATRVCLVSSKEGTMRVPGSSGAIELRTLMGTPACQAGSTAAGCTTFEPKVESSAASSKVNTRTSRPSKALISDGSISYDLNIQ